MRIRTLARRSVATLAATTLLTTGGAALGLSTGVANAQTVTSVRALGGGNPVALNNGVSAFEVNGSDFMPSNQESVILSPNPGITGQGGIQATVRDNKAQCASILGSVPPDAKCSGPLVFDVNLSMAAPGVYDVVVTQFPKTGLTNTPEPDVCVKCVTVVSAGPATTTSVAPSSTSNGPLTITGTNFAHGAQVKFFNTDANGAATTIDTQFGFTGINIVSPTTLTGVYSAQPTAVGRKVIRVFNLDDTVAAGPGAAFLQPKVDTISPLTLGQGATSASLTVNGGGFHPNSSIAWSDPKLTATGPIVLAPAGNSFVVPVSVAPDTTPGAKSLTVKSPGGGFTTVTNALTVTAAPRITSITPPARGQGSSTTVTVNGSGFTANTVFDFGAGITATPPAVPSVSSTAVTVNVAIAPDAAVGPRSVTATNADKGTSTLANAFTVVAKPTVTSVDPASAGPSATVPVKIYGRDFEASGVTVTLSGTGVTVGTVTVDSPTQLSTTFTSSNAPFGPRDVTVVNNSSQGKSTCAGCYGINSMSISPTNAVNNASKVLTLTGNGLNGNSVPILTIPGSQTYQGPITGTNVACGTPTANQICSQFDLSGVATGKYTVTATTVNGPLTCTACLTVVSAVSPAPTTVNPATGGQGAQLRTLQIAGSGFSPGEDVIFSGTGITTSKVTFNSPTLITAVVSIAENAATGGRTVTVKNIGDGRSGSTSPTAFTVTPSPKVTAIDVKQLGQNGVADVTVTGSNFVNGTTVDFGPGTTAVVKGTPTATSLVATVTVADGAGVGPRDVRVTNPDGGSSTLTGQFAVTPAPRISSISPALGKPGETKTVVISGSGFATSPATPSTNTAPTACPSGDAPAVQCPTIIVAGLLATVKSVSVDGTSMTADFAISPQTPISTPAAKVINPDRGQSSKLAAFRIATVPTAPQNVAVVVTGTTAKVTWTYTDTSPTNGGSPLTGFVVDDGDASTNNAQTLAPAAREATFTGLVASKLYTFSVRAVNAVGQSNAALAATSQYDTTLTVTRSKSIAAPGDLIRYTGTLRRSNGTPAPNAAILVTLDPDVGPTRVFTSHTDGVGGYGFRYPTYYNMTVSAKFMGNATDKASVAQGFRMATVTRVVKKSPASGSVSSHTSPLVVTGYVTPNKAGRVVYLIKGNGSLVGRAVVQSDRTFTFRVNLPAGNHLLAVTIKPSTGNIGGSTPFFYVKRT